MAVDAGNQQGTQTTGSGDAGTGTGAPATGATGTPPVVDAAKSNPPGGGDQKPPATTVAEISLKPIEGGVLDDAGVAGVLATAKELGLTQDAANKLLAAQDTALRGFQDAQISAFEKRQAEWTEATAKDAEIGGDKATETEQAIDRVLQRFDGDKTFKAELEATGFAKHPIVRKFLSRIGKAMSEDGGTSATPKASEKTLSRADRMYGSKK